MATDTYNPNAGAINLGSSPTTPIPVGGLTENQMQTIWNNQLGRNPVPAEVNKYKTAPISTLANLKASIPPAYNTATGFITDYGKSIGLPPIQPNDPANQTATPFGGGFCFNTSGKNSATSFR